MQRVKLTSHTIKFSEKLIKHNLRTPGFGTCVRNQINNSWSCTINRKRTMTHFILIWRRKIMKQQETSFGGKTKERFISEIYWNIKNAYSGKQLFKKCKSVKGFVHYSWVYHGFIPSHFLFATVITVLARFIQDEISWCMFVEETFLVDDITAAVSDK